MDSSFNICDRSTDCLNDMNDASRKSSVDAPILSSIKVKNGVEPAIAGEQITNPIVNINKVEDRKLLRTDSGISQELEDMFFDKQKYMAAGTTRDITSQRSSTINKNNTKTSSRMVKALTYDELDNFKKKIQIVEDIDKSTELIVQNWPTFQNDHTNNEKKDNSFLGVENYKDINQADNNNCNHSVDLSYLSIAGGQEQVPQNDNTNQFLDISVQGQELNGSLAVNQEEMSLEEKLSKLDEILTHFAKFKRRRTLFFCWTTSIMFLISLIFFDQVSLMLRGLFIICYIFLSYYLIENIIKASQHDILPWKKVENLYDVFEVAMLLIFLLFADLNYSGLNVPTKYCCFLPLINLFTYFWKSQAPKSLKEIQLAFKLIYSFQMFLLAAKIDGEFRWPWKAILCFVWFYLILAGIYFILSAMSWTWVTFSTIICKRVIYENMSKATQIIGFLWITLYSGVGVLFFFGILGACFVFDSPEEKSKMMLKVCLICGTGFSGLVVLLTILRPSLVLEFLIKFNYEEGDYKAQLGIKPNETGSMKVKKEKKDIYLIKLSSTYFSFLNKGFSHKGRDNIDKLKKVMTRARSRTFKRSESHLEILKTKVVATHDQKENQQPEQSSIEQKENIRKKSNNLLNVLEPNPLSLVCRQSISNFRSPGEILKMIESPYAKPNKVCLSEGNKIDTYESQYKDPQQDMCYICYARPQNAVMDQCGHGGICINCAEEVIKTQGQCMECRQKVKAFIKIELDPKFKDIIKGYETITIISDNIKVEAG